MVLPEFQAARPMALVNLTLMGKGRRYRREKQQHTSAIKKCDPGQVYPGSHFLILVCLTVLSAMRLNAGDEFQDVGQVNAIGVGHARTVIVGHIGVDRQDRIGAAQQIRAA